MDKWKAIPTDETIEKIVQELNKNGFNTTVVENGEEAKKKVFEIVPEGSNVMSNTSVTLEQIGVLDQIDNSGKYISTRKKIFSLDREKDSDEIRKLRAFQDFALGSAHAVTENGQIMIASNTGSQLAGEVFGAKKVILVIGVHKIVKDIAEGEKRIFEYVLPLESERARKAYGLPETWNSYPSKILLYNREVVKDRVNVILVKEVLGF